MGGLEHSDRTSAFDRRPMVMLCAQAERQPRRPALRVRQHGSWVTLSWSELALRVLHAAQGWTALGVGPEDTVVAASPLSESFIVTLFALQALGARLKVAHGIALDEALAGATFVLAHGTAEVDRVLMQRPHGLRALVVENHFGTEPSAGDALVGWQRLREPAGVLAGRLLAVPAFDRIALDAPAPEGGSITLTAGDLARMVPSPRAAPAMHPRTVLAEFAPHWLPGLRWLTAHWPIEGSTLVIAEPQGRAGAELRSRPDLWLVGAQPLAAFDAWVRGRIPARKSAARATNAALDGAGGPLHALRRRCLRRVLGLAGVQQVRAEQQASSTAAALLQHLGITVHLEPAGSQAVEAQTPRVPVRGQARQDYLEPMLHRVPT